MVITVNEIRAGIRRRKAQARWFWATTTCVVLCPLDCDASTEENSHDNKKCFQRPYESYRTGLQSLLTS